MTVVLFLVLRLRSKPESTGTELPLSSLRLGLLEQADALATGSGGAVDWGQAVGLLERATDQGDPVARFYLALALRYGRLGLEADFDRAMAMSASGFDELRGKAESGDALAMAVIGSCFHAGLGASANADSSMYWLGRSEELGNTTAMVGLGIIDYEASQKPFGPDRRRDAVRRFLRAAEAGDVNGMYYAAQAAAQGVAGPPDPAAARHWLEEAARIGHPLARLALQDAP